MTLAPSSQPPRGACDSAGRGTRLPASSHADVACHHTAFRSKNVARASSASAVRVATGAIAFGRAPGAGGWPAARRALDVRPRQRQRGRLWPQPCAADGQREELEEHRGAVPPRSLSCEALQPHPPVGVLEHHRHHGGEQPDVVRGARAGAGVAGAAHAVGGVDEPRRARPRAGQHRARRGQERPRRRHGRLVRRSGGCAGQPVGRVQRAGAGQRGMGLRQG